VPRARPLAFREADGSVPLLDWLASLSPKALDKCRVRIQRLAELGHELRRPEADYLSDGIYELRARHRNVNLRILYFFPSRAAVTLTHGFTKQGARVPRRGINLALRRKRNFERSPVEHTYEGEVG
jgi:phage-related protein